MEPHYSREWVFHCSTAKCWGLQTTLDTDHIEHWLLYDCSRADYTSYLCTVGYLCPKWVNLVPMRSGVPQHTYNKCETQQTVTVEDEVPLNGTVIFLINGEHDHSIRDTFNCIIADHQISFWGEVNPMGKGATVIIGLLLHKNSVMAPQI